MREFTDSVAEPLNRALLDMLGTGLLSLILRLTSALVAGCLSSSSRLLLELLGLGLKLIFKPGSRLGVATRNVDEFEEAFL